MANKVFENRTMPDYIIQFRTPGRRLSGPTGELAGFI